MLRKCPKCNSSSTRRSRRSVKVRRLSHLFTVLFRCEDCGRHFRRFGTASRGVQLSGAVAIVALLGFALWITPSRIEVSPGGRKHYATTDFAKGLQLPEVPLTDPAMRQAAENGDLEAMYRLSLDLLQGFRESGNPAALEQGIALLRDAAEQGHPRAQLAYGTQYVEGRGVIQNYATAATWFRKAADQGEPVAMLRLGLMMESGKGVDIDPVESYIWLNLAAARGETRAEMARDRVRGNLSPEEVRRSQDRSMDLDQKIPRPASTYQADAAFFLPSSDEQ